MTKAIVIGGGIAGCSTAYALAQRGIVVTLIERHEKLAQEASGNPIAMLYPKFSTNPNLADKLALQGLAYTLKLLKKLPTKNPIYETCGLIQLAFNTREQAKQTALIQLQELQQLLQPLNATEASNIAGVALNVGGLYLSQAGWLKPTAFCEALCASPLISKMVSTKALKIEKSQNIWQAFIDENHVVEADIVVICNANDIKQFKQCTSVAITAVRGQVNFFAKNSISKSIKTIICGDHFISPAVDEFHSMGTTYAPNDLNPQLSEAHTYQNMHALRKISEPLFASLANATLSGRVGWRSATLDYMPLAGQLLDDDEIRSKAPRYNANPADLPWLHGLYVNAGHGSKGMITAPICGELVAAMAYNEAPNIDVKLTSKLNPSRFLLRELGLKALAQTLYR